MTVSMISMIYSTLLLLFLIYLILISFDSPGGEMPRSVLNRLIGAQFAKLEVNYCCGVWEKPHYQLLKKCQAIIGIFNGAGLCLGPAGASRVGIHS